MSSVIDEYMGKVYAIVMFAATGACMIVGITFGLLKALVFYPAMSWVALGIFVGTCCLYLGIGAFLVKNAYMISAENGKKVLRPEMLKIGKIFLFIVLIIQFNFISYLVPTREFWGYIFFFLMFAALFLDVKLVTASGIGLTISLVVSSIVRREVLLPVMDASFIPEVLLRVIAVFLSVGIIVLLTFLISHFLINMKKEELERNNARVQYVLTNAAKMAAGLGQASSALADVAQNESASAEELAATSRPLMTGSNELIERANASVENLNELKDCGNRMNTNVEQVEDASGNLLRKSEENEALLHSLKEINEQVSASMNDTNKVADRLSEAVGEIGVTLNVINEISESTNLLPLKQQEPVKPEEDLQW